MDNIDIIYNEVDRFMHQNDWNHLSHKLIVIADMASDYSLDELLAWATATLPAKSKIRNRSMFIEKCKQLYPEPELWRGLE
jgi:hypothetical protein